MRYVVFLDIKKTFETVDHQILIQKLGHYRFQGNGLDFIEKQTAVLSDRRLYLFYEEDFLWSATGLNPGTTSIHIVHE